MNNNLNQKTNLDTTREELLKSACLPMFNNKNISEAMIAQTRYVKNDDIPDNAETNSKHKLLSYREISGPASTAVVKLYHMAIAYLTCDDITKRIIRGPDGRIGVNPTVKIPLLAYGKLNGYELQTKHFNNPDEQAKENRRAKNARNHFRAKMRTVLLDLLSINYYFDSPDEKLFDAGYIISHASIVTENGKEYIKLNFDVDIAMQVLGSPKVQNVLPLYSLDDRNPNAYYVGYTIASHASINSNIQKGTANTLKVKTLLSKMPEVISYEKLKSQGRRDWKPLIKEQLEDALNKNIEVGFLISWIYRDSYTNEIISIKEANQLSYEEFYELSVDFTFNEDLCNLQNKLTAKK